MEVTQVGNDYTLELETDVDGVTFMHRGVFSPNSIEDDEWSNGHTLYVTVREGQTFTYQAKARKDGLESEAIVMRFLNP